MKTTLQLFFLIFLFSTQVFAGDGKLYVTLKADGISSSINLAEVKKLEFNSGKLIAYPQTGSSQEWNLTDLRLLSFQDYGTPTGIESISGSKALYSVYPVPFTNGFNLEFELQQQCELSFQIIGVNGAVVLSKMISGQSGLNNVHIDASHLTPGIYFCVINHNGEIQTKKIVKQ